MINSMTAFAKAETINDGLAVGVEIKTYNHRHLDFSVRVPHGYNALEEKIKGLAAEKLTRGRVEIRLQVRDESDEACAYEIDEKKAAGYCSALRELKDKFGVTADISLELLAGTSGIIRPAENKRDLDAQWEVIASSVNLALDDLIEMRKVEGAHLAKDFTVRLDDIEKTVAVIEAESDDLIGKYRERLEERIKALTNGMVEIDPGRIAQEAAFLADRSDISEEVVRAKSHVKQFRSIMDGSEPGGRKLNFLLQEFNREFNTMGSKAGNTKVSHMIVSVKSELEKLREQVQNVE